MIATFTLLNLNSCEKKKIQKVESLFTYCSSFKTCITSGCGMVVGNILHRAPNKSQGMGQKQLCNWAVMSALKQIGVSF